MIFNKPALTGAVVGDATPSLRRISGSASVSLVLMIQIPLTQKVWQQGIETEGTSGKLTLIW